MGMYICGDIGRILKSQKTTLQKTITSGNEIWLEGFSKAYFKTDCPYPYFYVNGSKSELDRTLCAIDALNNTTKGIISNRLILDECGVPQLAIVINFI